MRMVNPSKVLLTRFGVEVAMASLTAIVGGIVVWGAREFGTGWGDAGPQPGYFPFYVGVIILVASGGVLVEALLDREARHAKAFLTREQAGRVLAFLGPIAGFVVLAVLLGLYVGLVIYLTATMVFQGRYRLYQALAVSLGAAIACYAVFEIWFQVPLLKGPLEALLNL
jgi:hypothetical protein